MTDEPDPAPGPSVEPAGGPADDSHVRALLAELGSAPDPIPADVVARLDDTLAALVAERTLADGATEQRAAPATSADEHTAGPADRPEEQRRGDVVPLRARGDSRGASRWASRTTAAAAAVIVLAGGGVAAATFGLFGPGTSQLAESAGSARSDATARSDAAEGSDSATEPDTRDGGTEPSPRDPGALSDLDGSIPRDSGPLLASPDTGTTPGLPALQSATFAEGVEALLARSGAAAPQQSPQGSAEARPDAEDGPRPEKQAPSGSARTGSCPGPANRVGVRRDVLLDGLPAVLLVRPERAGRQVVEAWDCAGLRTRAATTLRR